MSKEEETTGKVKGTGTGPQHSEGSVNAFRRAFRRYFPLILILWVLFVLYPNPLNLFVSIHRFLNPAVDPSAVEALLDELPSDPAAIEKAIRARISYGLDWELYGMPWYFPSVEQVVERGQGDCKARAMVLASVLKAKEISSQVSASPVHVWVDYEDKQDNSFENDQVKFFQNDPETGETRFQVSSIDLGRVMDSWRQQLWTPMPTDRRVLLFSGILGLVAARVVLCNRRVIRTTTTKQSARRVDNL
jgi:hypothetical protein